MSITDVFDYKFLEMGDVYSITITCFQANPIEQVLSAVDGNACVYRLQVNLLQRNTTT